MKTTSNNSLGLLARRSPARLPPGVRDCQCEGTADCRADEAELWRLCGSAMQERLSGLFAESNIELLRDAILDAQDERGAVACGPPDAPIILAGELLRGGSIWSAWSSFRDRQLRTMRRGGELPFR